MLGQFINWTSKMHFSMAILKKPCTTNNHRVSLILVLLIQSVFLKSLYGLKQAPRAWYKRFASYLTTLGFTPSPSNVSLFIYKNGSQLAYLLLYVNDIILMTSSLELLHSITTRLHSEFAMTDLGDLSYFLGIFVTRSPDGLHLSQRQYALDLLKRAGMAECHVTTTPVDTRGKLSVSDGPPVSNASDY
jgi:hypothetical protein